MRAKELRIRRGATARLLFSSTCSYQAIEIRSVGETEPITSKTQRTQLVTHKNDIQVQVKNSRYVICIRTGGLFPGRATTHGKRYIMVS